VQNDEGIWKKQSGKPPYIVVASEKLNDLSFGWEEVPPQTMLLLDENKSIKLHEM